MSKSEEKEQNEVARFLDKLNIVWCHVPNGGYRSWKTASRLKHMGVKSGVPDILIFDNLSGYNGVAIEMKKKEGRQTSKEQEEWLSKLEKRGWFTTVAHGAKEAIDIVQDLL